jgi:hypothetical protein
MTLKTDTGTLDVVPSHDSQALFSVFHEFSMIKADTFILTICKISEFFPFACRTKTALFISLCLRISVLVCGFINILK